MDWRASAVLFILSACTLLVAHLTEAQFLVHSFFEEGSQFELFLVLIKVISGTRLPHPPTFSSNFASLFKFFAQKVHTS